MEIYENGLDNELETTEEQESTEELGAASAEKKPKRKPFHVWTVNGTGYKLKLTTRMVEALERKYKNNVLNLILVDGLPRLSVMLTVIQAAATPWQHGMKYKQVKSIYDQWQDEGGNQQELLAKVIMPTMVVSGFFTEDQESSIMEGLEETTELL